MRCHPGVSYPLERVVPEQGIVIAGVHLQAGTIVGMSAPVMHCNRDVFGHDADAFNPDRWLLSDAETIKRMDRHLMTVSISEHAGSGSASEQQLTKTFSLATEREHALERTLV